MYVFIFKPLNLRFWGEDRLYRQTRLIAAHAQVEVAHRVKQHQVGQKAHWQQAYKLRQRNYEQQEANHV